jgi:hypothetical protein
VYDLPSSSEPRKRVDIQVDHQLFSLHKMNLDPIDPTKEAIIACAWSGDTYVLDEHYNLITYQFDQRVSAFAAGNTAK